MLTLFNLHYMINDKVLLLNVKTKFFCCIINFLNFTVAPDPKI